MMAMVVQMIKSFLLKHWFDVLMLAVALFMAGVYLWDKHVYSQQVVALQNAAASTAKTIETANGVYEKLTLQLASVQSVVDSKDPQIKELEAEVQKNHEQISDATSVSLYWKQKYQSAINVTQTTVPAVPPSASSLGSAERIKVSFTHDFGPYHVEGYTLTNPAYGWLTLSQLQPLKLTMAVTQDKTGAWHSYVTSSDNNTQADILVSAVNPNLRTPHWYEKLALQVDLGLGSTSGGAGVLTGIGGSYDFGSQGQFSLGPKAWLTVSNHVDTFYGLNFGWHPFTQQR
jgi:hypothetical protein